MELNKEKVNYIIKKLSEGLYEKDEVIALTFLCALAGKSVFLYGPPGTAKSLIVRRIASAFKDSTYFGQLMNRFTTPEDVFGPVSLSKLKEDKFERQTEGYLPKADFVFLDEIWKSSPAILNTLLTIINEKVYRNGSAEEKVPLKALVSASNETPPKGQGLEAMYDRFIMRLFVDTAKDVDNFVKLISDKDVAFDASFNDDEKISTQYLEKLKSIIEDIKVPENVLNIICSIKDEIDEYNKGNNDTIYISDRRWKNIVYILKTAAYLCDREEILPVDCFLITHCIWTLEENIEAVKKIVEKSIKSFSQISRKDFEMLSSEVNTLKKDIQSDCINDKNVYDTEVIDGEEFCKIHIDYFEKDNYYNTRRHEHTINLFIPIDKINTKDNFKPLDEKNKVIIDFDCLFENSEIIKITSDNRYYYFNNGDKELLVKLPIKSEKGTYKTITSRTKDNYIKSCDELTEKIDNAVKKSEEDLKNQNEKIDSPFVAECYRNIILKSYEDYIADFKSKRLEVEQEKNKVEQCQTINN
ncbi:AAA family ATPase [Brachyspira murdochii]|uniref:ATPase associated with various cellular activities AAA_5 n=1 Tax=Brachyspira murdochii (strain ATCC 51284 / DSM 12563 / 56-150) TaxID=526224 RepID=D5U7T0_BRAM5|nr:AAA family ATPase [Brachyspira murdochii]ADG72876.1 ATPase associated with various cellular activities AAA_5 [Brachyspira murdochii DSM 12563]